MKARYKNNSLEAQLLEDHLISVSKLSGVFARTFGFETEAELAGLLHDIGM